MSAESSQAQKSDIDEAVDLLKALKLEKIELEKQLEVLESSRFSGMTKEKFRKAVDSVCQKHQFYYPTGVAGYYDYGIPGVEIENQVLALWDQHFASEEEMARAWSTPELPEAVLKASGHIDKFTDIMVKDEKTGASYRADHLLRDHCKDKLEKDHALKSEDVAELKHIIAVIDDMTIYQVGAKIKEYGIVAPDTKNPLSDPFLFNLMFPVETGSGPGYYRPELAQGIFINFNQFYNYLFKKTLPFAVAEVGFVYRNEISPRQKLLRLKKFKLAEIEHFVDPKDKSHPKFSNVSNLELFMLPAAEQKTGQTGKRLCLDYAVTKGIISSQILAYYIGRVYLFLTKLGIHEKRLRFRQHLPNEMAHYASDCWDAEIEISYGWTECVGISDRGDHDLHAHSILSKIPLLACEKFAKPKRYFFPHVIEPSFGISRILYCLYEHSFYTRPNIKGNKHFHVFRFLPSVAPIKCAVLPLIKDQLLVDDAARITESFKKAGVYPGQHLIKGASIGQKYAMADELGVPFIVTVSKTCVTIRERDSRDLIYVNVDEVVAAVKKLITGEATWADISQKLSEERDSKEKMLKEISERRTTWTDVFQMLYGGSKSS